MAKAAVKTHDDDDDDDVVTKKSAKEVDPKLASDVAPGFTAGPVPAAKDISKIVLDTTTYGTETPPRQTPPTSIDNAIKHSPPSFHDSNGVKIASVAPTLGTPLAPTGAVAGTGADFTLTGTGTNFDRATFLTMDGAILTQTAYVSATSLTALIKPSQRAPGAFTSQVTAKNPAGESVQRAFNWT